MFENKKTLTDSIDTIFCDWIFSSDVIIRINIDIYNVTYYRSRLNFYFFFLFLFNQNITKLIR